MAIAPWTVTLLLACPLPGTPPGGSIVWAQEGQDPPTTRPEREPDGPPEVTSATHVELARLLAEFKSARKSGDAMEIAKALAPMSIHDNLEFAPLALDALKYRASKLDKKAAKARAKELDTTSKKELAALVAQREAVVQEAAAHVLANYPEDKKALKALEKAFGDKAIRRDKPRVVSALVVAFGKLHNGEVEDEVVEMMERGVSKEITRACVRYLGTLPTRDYDHVCLLCTMLASPEPAAVNSPINPPAEYWENLWAIWNWTRRDVSWALKEITGQVFRPSDGDHESDCEKALDYVEANREALGLR
ncbi:MAG: hypothetical protein AAGB93_10855 [Planctomycetota bacterium]